MQQWVPHAQLNRVRVHACARINLAAMSQDQDDADAQEATVRMKKAQLSARRSL